MTQEEKLEEAKKLYETANEDQRYVLEQLFPELKESGDERIRKALIKIFKHKNQSFIDELTNYSGDIKIEEVLSWLEKQGQKETTYGEDMSGAIEYCIKNNRPLEKEHLAWLEKNGKQNSAWSNVDEYTLGETIQHLEELIRIEKVKHCGIDVQYYQRDIDWLKSLKDRVQPQNKWKPTEEQMDALDSALQYSNVSYETSEYLNSLFNDLKKL